MRIYMGKELKEILKLHRDWLNNIEDGKRADLSDANLSDADLSYANLSGADLCGADLNNTDLSYANLSGANLGGADLNNTDLRGANLSYADLRGANLCGANLCGAAVEGIKRNEKTAFFDLQCPEEGDFVAWKKCKKDVIVKLLVTGKRSSATTRKCRCSEAKVLEVIGADVGISKYDWGFIYRAGEIVKVDDFNEDRWDECSTGIHFFLTKSEAEQY